MVNKRHTAVRTPEDIAALTAHHAGCKTTAVEKEQTMLVMV
jgi:hypothetical protein